MAVSNYGLRVPPVKCRPLASMRILVTGHLGYLGTVLVPVLLDAGHSVVGLDSDLYADCTFTDGIAPVPELRIDVRDVDAQKLAGRRDFDGPARPGPAL